MITPSKATFRTRRAYSPSRASPSHGNVALLLLNLVSPAHIHTESPRQGTPFPFHPIASKIDASRQPLLP